MLFARTHARADTFVVPEGAEVRPLSHRVFIRHDSGRETLIEEMDVRSTARSFLWIRTRPTPPKTAKAVEPAVFAALEETTRVEPPHELSVRERMFGPSIVSLVLTRLSRDPRVTAEPEQHAQAERDLVVLPPLVLTERIPTSTVTRSVHLPKALVDLAAREKVSIPVAVQHELVATIERGWVVLVSAVHDPQPSKSGAGRLGPARTDFVTPRAVYPSLAFEPTSPVWYDVYALSQDTLLPRGLETDWEERPWERRPIDTQRYVVQYNRAVAPESEATRLAERYEILLPETPKLTHARMILPSDRRTDLELLVRENTVELPKGGEKGSATDLLFCVLAGLSPLFYTPESWLLLWVTARARARARRGDTPLSLHVWPAYAVLVGLFWLGALQGFARIAAMVPLLLGVWLLGMPFVDREPPRVLVEFGKKKKKKDKGTVSVAKAN